MGYACPVCGDPQADGRHLANHLAFTAILGDADHEAWLDDHAGDWGEMGEGDLASVVTDAVEETDFPQVFEDTVGGLDASSESPAARSGALFDDEQHHEHGDGPARTPRADGEPTDEETAAILEEAREMTREMLGETERDRTDEDADRETTDGETERAESEVNGAGGDGATDAGDADNNG